MLLFDCENKKGAPRTRSAAKLADLFEIASRKESFAAREADLFEIAINKPLLLYGVHTLMLNQVIKPEQDQTKLKVGFEQSQLMQKNQAIALGDWQGRIIAADPDPQMITNPHYWNAYCLGQYKRYLKKYGIKQVNEA